MILPTNGGDPLVAFPLALPMGWVESLPYFTSVTKTSCDLLNAALQRWDRQLPYHLESLALTPPLAATPTPRHGAQGLAYKGLAGTRTPPLAYGDVYVDDFILAAQTTRHQQHIMRSALHSIDRVLRSLACYDGQHRKAPVSVKKLRQGDACWATRKTVLG